MKIAIPTDPPGGVNSQSSQHFGHVKMFTIVELDYKELKEIIYDY